MSNDKNTLIPALLRNHPNHQNVNHAQEAPATNALQTIILFQYMESVFQTLRNADFSIFNYFLERVRHLLVGGFHVVIQTPPSHDIAPL